MLEKIKKRTPLEILEETVEESMGMSADEIRKMPLAKHRRRAERKHGGPLTLHTPGAPPTSAEIDRQLDEAVKTLDERIS